MRELITFDFFDNLYKVILIDLTLGSIADCLKDRHQIRKGMIWGVH